MMKTNMKKKILISGLTISLIGASNALDLLRIHGDSTITNIKAMDDASNRNITPRKGLYIKNGTVTGMNEDGSTNNTPISDYETITDLIIDSDVITIPNGLFDGLQNLKTLTFKDVENSKVSEIGNNAFRGTSIASVILPKDLREIAASAFANTTKLTTVSFAQTSKLAIIGNGAFQNSALTGKVDLSPIDTSTAANLSVGERAFQGNANLTEIILSTKMSAINSLLLANTGITSITIPKSISTIRLNAFEGTALAEIKVDSANTTYTAENNILYNNNKTRLVLYPSAKPETNFTVPNSVTHINSYAMSSLKNLTDITLGTGVTNLGDYAFAYSANLKKVTTQNALTQIGEYVFKGTGIESIALKSSLQGIGPNAFAGASKLTKLDLRGAAALLSVKENAFKDTALDTMIIGMNTGALNQITANAFHSTASSRKISFLNTNDTAITGNDLTTLQTKYAALKNADNGSWTFDIKLATPNARVNYDDMKLENLTAGATYIIDNGEYTADRDGKIDLPKAWGGKTITIVQKATDGNQNSDPQSLAIEGIYTLTIDGTKYSDKKVGASITLTAEAKAGHVFSKWETSDVALPNPTNKQITFTMPNKDVNLSKVYKEINVTTPVKEMVYNGKDNLIITFNTEATNFVKLVSNGTTLIKDSAYSILGTDTTIITLNTTYLNTLTDTTEFAATFSEGGDIAFSVRLYGSAPAAAANYDEMKLTNLEANTPYKINNEVITTDAEGKINIKKDWGSQTLEIVKIGNDTETDSKPQHLRIAALYTVNVDGTEIGFKTEGTSVTVKAESKNGYKFKGWQATGVVLTNPDKEEVTFNMPASNVKLTTSYTEIITTAPEDLVYNGEEDVVVRFDLPITEFEYIEFDGKRLVKDVDYTVTSGSTVITFTKSFLDNVKGDINGIKAVFTNASVEFTIKNVTAAPEETPTPPVVPVPPITPDTPTTPNTGTDTLPEPNMPNKPSKPTKPNTTSVIENTVKTPKKTPDTGDNTNILYLFGIMLASLGAIVLVLKKKLSIHK